MENPTEIEDQDRNVEIGTERWQGVKVGGKTMVTVQVQVQD